MNKTYKGQVTLEAAIVVPFVMIIVISLIYFSMIIHDGIVVRTCVYGIGNTYCDKDYDIFQREVREALQRAPLFAIFPSVDFKEHLNYYEITIKKGTTSRSKLIDKIAQGFWRVDTIEIEKKMQTEHIYASQVILNQLEKGGKK